MTHRLRSLAAVTVVSVCVAGVAAQSPSFEAASIKASDPGATDGGIRLLPGGRLTIASITLAALIRLAYGSEIVQTPDQIVGGPPWMRTDRFDLVATVGGDTAARSNTRPEFIVPMLKSLIEDRFSVRAHTENRDIDAAFLAFANPDKKPGPSLRRSVIACPAPEASAPDANGWCGIRRSAGKITAQGVTLAAFAASLANLPVVGRAVRDGTGLSGLYDLSLDFDPSSIRPGTSNGDVPSLSTGPSFFTAMSEQLGLKLDLRRAPTQVIVVDQAARPSPD